MALQFSQGAPADTLGANGDYALDTTNRFFYGPKASGSWAGVPTYSLTGPSGPVLVYGSGAPAAGVGQIGQVYLNLVNGDTYGPKTSGGWSATPAGNFRGTQGVQGVAGTRGSVYWTGSGAFVSANYPNAIAGLDYYIDTSSSGPNVYSLSQA